MERKLDLENSCVNGCSTCLRKLKLTFHSFCFALLLTGFQLVQSTFIVAPFIRPQGSDVSSLPAATMFKHRCNQNEPVSTSEKDFYAWALLMCSQCSHNCSHDCTMPLYIIISKKKFLLRNSPMASLSMYKFFQVHFHHLMHWNGFLIFYLCRHVLPKDVLVNNGLYIRQ